MREQILAALSQYGSPVLFGVVTVAAVGIPLPVTMLLIVSGSLAAQGLMNFWWVIGLASAGSVIGDQLGYFIGRWGGQRLISRFTGWLGGREKLSQMEAKARHWGGSGIFFSRWLVTPLGPWINFASGMAEYPWMRFTFWDVLGEALGAVLYVALGRTFSDRVVELDAVLGDFSWAAVALVVALWLGWKLWRYTRRARE